MSCHCERYMEGVRDARASDCDGRSIPGGRVRLWGGPPEAPACQPLASGRGVVQAAPTHANGGIPCWTATLAANLYPRHYRTPEFSKTLKANGLPSPRNPPEPGRHKGVATPAPAHASGTTGASCRPTISAEGGLCHKELRQSTEQKGIMANHATISKEFYMRRVEWVGERSKQTRSQ